MYRYYQCGEMDAWTPVPAKTAIEGELLARQAGATKLTVLSVSAVLRDDISTKELDGLKYRGPLYFDIDCKDDLPLAIESGKLMVKNLIALGIPEEGIDIYLSGSKGVHIMVDERYFSTGRPLNGLPLIYKEMARELYVPGLDMGVYAQGKGNSFRLANIQRGDGNYRVPVGLDVLQGLTTERYREMVKLPRTTAIEVPDPEKSPALMSLFEECKKRVGSRVRQVMVVGSEQLKAVTEEAPQCVQKLVNWDGIKSEANFNQVATQVAIYIARAGLEDQQGDALINRLADHAQSSKYDSTRLRQTHTYGQLRYMQVTEKYAFGCNAMRGLLERRPCEGCPLEATHGGSRGDDGGLSAQVRMNGYAIQNADGQYRRISNFLLHPVDAFIDVPLDGTTERRIGTICDVMKDQEKVGRIMLREDAFLSRAALLRELSGLVGLSFIGTDNDVQAVKSVVHNDEQDVGQIRQVYTIGLHIERIDGNMVRTYVEPGLSVNNLKVQGTHQYWGRVVAPAYLGESSLPQPGSVDVEEVLLNLCEINHPIDVAVMLGWASACHYKAHIFSFIRQFPLLNLFGNMSSGKSRTAALITWLCGTQYDSTESVAACPQITQFAALDYASSSTTVPRIFDEYNESKIDPRLFKYLGELFKSSWDGASSLKGTISKRGENGRTGAAVNEIPITSPIIVVGEQEVHMPALQDRSLRVHLKQKNREGREGAHDYISKPKHLRMIQQVAKAMMIQALRTDVDTVSDLLDEMDDKVDHKIAMRPRYSFKVVLFGLDRLAHLCETELQMPMAAEQVRKLASGLMDHLNGVTKTGAASGVIQEITTSSEVDNVLIKMGVMVTISRTALESRAQKWMNEGIEYATDGTFLWLDPTLAHAAYTRFSSQYERVSPVINEYRQFIKLLETESYFVERERNDRMITNRETLKLNLAKMADRGIDVSLFVEQDLMQKLVEF